MPRELAHSELESFPALDWSDIAPRLTDPTRASLDRILETQNGAALSLDQSFALAHSDGDDLLGLLAAAYVAEIVRAGLQSVPRSQIEAGHLRQRGRQKVRL